MSKPSKQAIESLAKEMLEDVPLSRERWDTASEKTKAVYRQYAQLVLEGGARRRGSS